MGNYADEDVLVAADNLPSRRWKTRRIRTARDKKIRGVDKEHTRVLNQIHDLGWEELNPPIQRGYQRLFVLTEATRYTKRASFYQGILDKINTAQFSSTKRFARKKRKIRKWRYRDVKEQQLQQPIDWQFHREGRFTEDEKKYFYPVEYYDYACKMWRCRYIFTEPWRFELRIRPYFITKVKRKDPALEQYRDELEDLRNRPDNFGRLIRMWGGNRYAWKKVINEKNDRKRYAYNSFRNVPLYRIVENYKEEQTWDYD